MGFIILITRAAILIPFRFRNRMPIFVQRVGSVAKCMGMSENPRKPSEPPVLKKLTPEQVQLLLLVHAGQNDQNAKQLLELVDPDTPYKT